MEEANNKEMNFFVRLYKAITNFDTYSKFAEEAFSKAFIYAIILTLILTIAITINYTQIFMSELTTGINYLNNNIEDINFVDGHFNYNNDQYAEYAGEDNLIPIVIVDTSEQPNIDEYKTKVELYNFGLIVLKDKILVPATEQEVSYSDYNIQNMSKQELLNIVDNNNVYMYIGIAIFIIEFVDFFMAILLDAIMLAVLGRLIALTLRMHIRFGAAYKMGIYALTLPMILQVLYIIVNSRTGFIIKNFLWLYMTIAYIYILIAILMIKTDFINTQKELIKIQLEQKKIHEEMEQQQEKDKKEEKKQEEEKDKDKKEDKHNEDGLNEQTQE